MAQFLTPQPVRFSRATTKKIAQTSKRIGLTKADTMRLAINAGLPIIEALPELIDQAAIAHVESLRAKKAPIAS